VTALTNVAAGALFSIGATSAPQFGILPVAQGGTGRTKVEGTDGLMQLLTPNDLGGEPSSSLYIALITSNWAKTGHISLQGLRNRMGLGDTLDILPVANGGTGSNNLNGLVQTGSVNQTINGTKTFNTCPLVTGSQSTDNNALVKMTHLNSRQRYLLFLSINNLSGGSGSSASIVFSIVSSSLTLPAENPHAQGEYQVSGLISLLVSNNNTSAGNMLPASGHFSTEQGVGHLILGIFAMNNEVFVVRKQLNAYGGPNTISLATGFGINSNSYAIRHISTINL